jgi:hypothetical protein
MRPARSFNDTLITPAVAPQDLLAEDTINAVCVGTLPYMLRLLTLTAVAVTAPAFSFHAGRVHSFLLAMRAPSARAPSFAQAIVGTTVGAAAEVAKPQSTPAMTFSRPTISA